MKFDNLVIVQERPAMLKCVEQGFYDVVNVTLAAIWWIHCYFYSERPPQRFAAKDREKRHNVLAKAAAFAADYWAPPDVPPVAVGSWRIWQENPHKLLQSVKYTTP